MFSVPLCETQNTKLKTLRVAISVEVNDVVQRLFLRKFDVAFHAFCADKVFDELQIFGENDESLSRGVCRKAWNRRFYWGGLFFDGGGWREQAVESVGPDTDVVVADVIKFFSHELGLSAL